MAPETTLTTRSLVMQAQLMQALAMQDRNPTAEVRTQVSQTTDRRMTRGLAAASRQTDVAAQHHLERQPARRSCWLPCSCSPLQGAEGESPLALTVPRMARLQRLCGSLLVYESRSLAFQGLDGAPYRGCEAVRW